MYFYNTNYILFVWNNVIIHGFKSVCQNKPLDIYFVVDISKSINKKELKQERDALRHLFDSFEIARGKTRIGLIKFHSLAETELTLGEQETNAGLRETKVLTRGKIRGGTRTDMAMNMMMDNFGKDTSSGRAKVCILLTDGRATAPLDKMIDRLHKSDIKVSWFYYGIEITCMHFAINCIVRATPPTAACCV